MKNYTKSDPVFNEEITITEPTDPGHADNINAAPKQIFENTLVNKKEIEEGDSKERTVTFTSGDSDTVDQWTDVAKMVSGEKHKSLFNKISTMFKNVRYLYNVLGSEDISQLGDGTVTGVLETLKAHAFAEPVNNLLANVSGRAMDAAVGPVIDTRFTAVEGAVTQINSDLSTWVNVLDQANVYDIPFTSNSHIMYNSFTKNVKGYLYIFRNEAQIENQQPILNFGFLPISNKRSRAIGTGKCDKKGFIILTNIDTASIVKSSHSLNESTEGDVEYHIDFLL